MAFNLFLFGAEVFKEFYSDTHHLIHYKYLFGLLHGMASPLAPFAWISLLFAVAAFLLFLIPATRKNVVTMNIGCLLIYVSVYIEKGVALIIPGYTPDVLGQVYQYVPSLTELRVSVGVFGIGFLLFTLMVKVSIRVLFTQPATTRA